NLGAAHLMLGNRRRHVEYTRTSAELFAARGENERAATLQANAGATLIDFGDDPVQGFRLVQNALTVFREARNTTGEVFALQVSAAYHRYRGEHAEAERLLQQALAISRQYGLKQRLWSLELDRLRSLYEIGEYETVRQRLMRDLPLAAGRDRAQGEILLALTETRLGDFEGARKRLVSVAAAAGANDETLHLLLAAARGELAYEANISAEARRWFDEAAARWTQEPPHARAVEALAYRGLLDGLRGDLGRAERALRQSLDRARLLGRLGLETRCRVFLARLAVERGRFDEAVRVLAEVPPDDAARTVGPELRAFVHYWRGRALAGLGDVKSRQELSAARRLVEDLRERLPDHGRKAFTARPDLRRILG
ncbi:MAG TPA: hypothetical protein VNI78_10010, partial [Vicinamibacterales bacterium]|nr:hypothetical protein [Vicinamibacterales bacterium]